MRYLNIRREILVYESDNDNRQTLNAHGSRNLVRGGGDSFLVKVERERERLLDLLGGLVRRSVINMEGSNIRKQNA